MSRLVIVNATLVLSDRTLPECYIICEEGVIISYGQGIYNYSCEDEIIDAKGCYVSPGFIDIHTHGAGGYDFMDNTIEAYLGIAETHAKYGTTSLLPTTLASSNDELYETLNIYKQATQQNKAGSQFLGIHLEGPYFAYEQKGAQDPAYLRNPVPEEYNSILSASNDIIRWSLAPELDGALEFGKCLKDKNILPSIAHSNAVYEQIEEAYQSGFTHVTHLYSCMSTITRRNAYRYAGVLEAAYLLEDMTVEIIADGIHVPSPLLKYVYKFKGPDKTALCTDSMRGAGMPDGVWKLGSLTQGQEVIVEDGVAKLPDRSAFAGSVATADRLVRTMIEQGEASLVDAIRMITFTPARIIGINNKKGSIKESYDADLVIFDSNINIQYTIVAGKIIYSKINHQK